MISFEYNALLSLIISTLQEMESTIIIDTLIRGGAKVTVASVESTLDVVCSRGVKISADTCITQCVDQTWDLVALPGGEWLHRYNYQ